MLKIKKRRILCWKKFKAVQCEHTDALTYVDMFNLLACWKTGAEARQEFAKLGNKTTRRNVVEEQHCIQFVGFGWKDL